MTYPLAVTHRGGSSKTLARFFITITLVLMQAAAAVGEEKPARTIRVRVLGPEGQPVAAALVHRAVWTKDEKFDRVRDFVTDEKGQAVVDLPRSLDILRLWARKDGLVPMFAHWEQDELAALGQQAVPAEFTIGLQKGTTVGGVVRNEEGEPIPGARVEVMREMTDPSEQGARMLPDIWLAFDDGARTTDAQGRWTLNNVPPGDHVKVRVKLSHPDYVDDQQWGALQHQQGVGMEALRGGSGAIVMHKGISVTGAVTDPGGRPVAGAVVVWGADPYFEVGSQEVRTDQNGVYRFPPLDPGPTVVTVAAQGWAPALKEITIAPANPPVDFQLQGGATVRIRFVDGAEQPVAGVHVGIAQWRGRKSLYNHKHPHVLDTEIPRQADANGLYQWTWAPEDEVTYTFYKEGYQELPAGTFSAGDREQTVRLRKQ